MDPRRELQIGQELLAGTELSVRKDDQVPLKVSEILKLIEADGWYLEADGWYLARTRGSHRQYRHPTKLGTDLPTGTGRNIRKQAGI
jgi:predicted RNA binding protein YcfA (HicA-like mRNA interferase family)